MYAFFLHFFPSFWQQKSNQSKSLSKKFSVSDRNERGVSKKLFSVDGWISKNFISPTYFHFFTCRETVTVLYGKIANCISCRVHYPFPLLREHSRNPFCFSMGQRYTKPQSRGRKKGGILGLDDTERPTVVNAKKGQNIFSNRVRFLKTNPVSLPCLLV